MAGTGEIFEVERLLKQRTKGGTTEYLVQWKGFGEKDQTWEPESNLLNCQLEIENLKASLSPVKKTPTRSQSKSRARSKSPARLRKQSPSKGSKSPKRSKSPQKKSPVRTRSRSRSRSRQTSTATKTVVQTTKTVVTPSRPLAPKPVKEFLPEKSVSAKQVTRVTTTSVSGRSSLAAGDASSYYLRERKPTQPVVVPQSLKASPPVPTRKGCLDRVGCKCFLFVVLLLVVGGVAAAHYNKVIDLNEMLEVVRSNLPELKLPAPTTPPKPAAPAATPAPKVAPPASDP